MEKEVENLSLTENRNPGFFYGYVVVVAFCLMVVAFGTLYSFGVFLKPLLTEFGWTRAMTSGPYSLCWFLLGFLCIVSGRLNDKFGPRIVLTVSGLLVGFGYLLMSQISAIWQLYLFYGVIVGAGLSCFFAPLNSTVARWFAKRRGMMTGIVVSGIGVGTLITPPIANWLISSYSWRTAYIILGVINLVFIILAAQFLKRDPGQMGLLPYGENKVKGEGSNLEAQGFSFQEAIRTRQFWLLSMMLVSFGFPLNTMMAHIAPHATDLGIPAATAANILAIIGGLSIAGRIIMGATADRIGNKPTFIIGFILMLVALLWVLVAKELWMLCLFAAIFGFAYGNLVALESPTTAELFGTRAHGAILGAVAAGFPIGGTIGPVLTGKIFDVTGSYQLAFLVCTAVAIAGLILTLLLRPISRQAGEELTNR